MLKIPLLYLAALVRAFFQKPFMQRLRKKHPRLISVIYARFSPLHFFGLPFTILLLLTAINLVLLSELAENVVNSEATKALDTWISTSFFKRRLPEISIGFYYFTQLGNVYGVIFIALIAGVYLLWKRRRFHFIALLVSVLGSGLSMQLLKEYFHRERPLNIAYYTTEVSYSFPSGHATAAIALEGLLVYFLISSVRSHRRRAIGSAVGIVYILLIGLSRIYLGVHFLTDVMAGYMLGFFWLLLSIALMEYLALRKLKRNKVKKVKLPKL
jgi:membrane-associated phospholipid phosphatase